MRFSTAWSMERREGSTTPRKRSRAVYTWDVGHVEKMLYKPFKGFHDVHNLTYPCIISFSHADTLFLAVCRARLISTAGIKDDTRNFSTIAARLRVLRGFFPHLREKYRKRSNEGTLQSSRKWPRSCRAGSPISRSAGS